MPAHPDSDGQLTTRGFGFATTHSKPRDTQQRSRGEDFTTGASQLLSDWFQGEVAKAAHVPTALKEIGLNSS